LERGFINSRKNKNNIAVTLIQTIKGRDYSTIDSRALEHNGCIIDVGCLKWDWSSYFIGKKRVIGVDPFENEINGAELFKGLIGISDGKTFIKYNGYSSSIFFSNKNGIEVSVLSWKSFCKLYNIDKISILKINIEGAEYSLLESLDEQDFEKIDQIAISFHDRKKTEWIEPTKTSLQHLEDVGFEIIKTNNKWNWYLARKI